MIVDETEDAFIPTKCQYLPISFSPLGSDAATAYECTKGPEKWAKEKNQLHYQEQQNEHLKI